MTAQSSRACANEMGPTAHDRGIEEEIMTAKDSDARPMADPDGTLETALNRSVPSYARP